MKTTKPVRGYYKKFTDLQNAHLEEMRQIYRFAELGQLGVTLLHDTANYVSALKLEVEDLPNRFLNNEITSLQNIIKHLEKVIDDARKRLNGSQQSQDFDIYESVKETIRLILPESKSANVFVTMQPPNYQCVIYGNPVSFSQIIKILLTNAIKAYDQSKSGIANGNRRVIIKTQLNQSFITVRISDWGRGISQTKRKSLFTIKPESNSAGLGIGLYIAKQLVEMDLKGSIKLSPRTDHTEFTIQLPVK